MHYYKISGGVLHWNVVTPTADILLDAVTTADGAILNLSHVCGGGGSPSETSTIATQVHLRANDDTGTTVVVDANPAALGDTVHDSANLAFTGGGTLPSGSFVVFSFWHNHDCDGLADDASGHLDVTGGSSPVPLDAALVEGPLAAGEYSYNAVLVSGDTSDVAGSESDCEPFMVDRADPTIRTDIHNAWHQVVTSVTTGSVVHDTATLGGLVTGFDPDLSKVSFTFFTNDSCDGNGSLVANGTAEPANVARSVATAPLAVGHYSYSATFAGDDNYTRVGPATCEPLSVFQLGLTMGFWGNKNGIARIEANGGYGGNAVNIGRGAIIDTKSESLKVLPLPLNACGKGNPTIFTGQTTSANCTLASGVNMSSLNTLAAQTLALGYNIKLVSGYNGQTIGDLACSAYVTAGLTGTNTVSNAFTAAVTLINGSASGGTTTQTQIGNMNLLLNCLNRET